MPLPSPSFPIFPGAIPSQTKIFWAFAHVVNVSKTEGDSAGCVMTLLMMMTVLTVDEGDEGGEGGKGVKAAGGS